MSKSNPTLHEWLRGFEILSAQKEETPEEYLVAYSYIPASQRVQIRNAKTNRLMGMSKKLISQREAEDFYYTITPKKTPGKKV